METLPAFPCYVGETNELWPQRFRQGGKSMKLQYSPTFALLAAIGACGPQHQQQAPAANESAPAIPAPSAPPTVSNNSVEAPAQTPAEAQPEAKPTVDPKGAEAAAALVSGFADLLNAGKFNDAYMLLGPNAPPRADFDRQFSRYSHLKVTVGKPGDQEGAAGSIYLSVPLTVSGDLDGKHSTRSATAIMRRVNDVPGSTEAQRRWHIERIDWGSGG
jgi:hypothetical protein